MKKKQLLVMVAMMLVVAMVSVAGTMAFLISSSGPVINSFSVGKLAITLDEAKVTEYGVVDATATSRVTANTYKLVPGHEYTKDPIVHFQPDSEEAWLFVKVENGIADIETTDDTKTIAAQIADNGWEVLESGEGYVIYFQKAAALAANAAAKDYKVFEKFTLKDDLLQTALQNKVDAKAKITVTAFAVQTDGFEGATDKDKAQAAWNATFGAPPQA